MRSGIMSEILIVTIIGSMVGIVGTGLGGLIALSIVRPNTRFIGMVLGITSGLMLAVVTFDLLPEAYEIGGLWVEILGIVLGIIMIFIIEDFIPAPKRNLYSKVPSRDFFRTGALLGATSGSALAVYAAALSASAPSVTIGAAMLTYCPPLLLAGTVTGVIGKVLYDKLKQDQMNKDIIEDGLNHINVNISISKTKIYPVIN